MKLRVRKTWSKSIGNGNYERIMVQPGVSPVGRRQGDCAVAARGPHGWEKRR